MSAGVYEGKYELDSIAAFLKLSRQYFNASQDADCFLNLPGSSHGAAGTKPDGRATATASHSAGASWGSSSGSSSESTGDDDGAPTPSPSLGCGIWVDAVARVFDVLEQQTSGTAALTESGWWYAFQRTTQVASDTLSMNGRGPIAASGTGLSQSWFRPSDDAQTLPFHAPSNAMALVELVEVTRNLELP